MGFETFIITTLMAIMSLVNELIQPQKAIEVHNH